MKAPAVLLFVVICLFTAALPAADPPRPGPGASRAEWAAWENAVAAKTQNDLAARQAAAAKAAADAQRDAELLQARIAAQLKAEREAANRERVARALAQRQADLDERTVQALEGLSAAAQLDVLRKLGWVK